MRRIKGDGQHFYSELYRKTDAKCTWVKRAHRFHNRIVNIETIFGIAVWTLKNTNSTLDHRYSRSRSLKKKKKKLSRYNCTTTVVTELRRINKSSHKGQDGTSLSSDQEDVLYHKRTSVTHTDFLPTNTTFNIFLKSDALCAASYPLNFPDIYIFFGEPFSVSTHESHTRKHFKSFKE